MLSLLYALKRHTTVVAVDYSDVIVKMVVLATNKVGYRLMCADSYVLESGIVVEGRIIKMEKLVEAIQCLIERNKIKNTKFAFVVPFQDITVKTIPYDNNFIAQLTYESDETIFSVLEETADQLISYSSDDIYIDYDFVPANDGTELVRLVGIHKDRALDYENLASMLKVEAEVLAVDAYLLSDYFTEIYVDQEPLKQKQCYAVIGLDAKSNQIHFLQHQNIIMQDSRNIGIELEGEEYMNMVVPWLMRNFQMYDVSHRDIEIKKIFIYGEMAGIEGLVQTIAEYTGKLAEIINPFETIEVLDASIEIENPASYVIATALATREVI